MMPLAPGRLSITNCCPSVSAMRCPTARAGTSMGLPGAKGTTMRTGFIGYLGVCAIAVSGKAEVRRQKADPATARQKSEVGRQTPRSAGVSQVILLPSALFRSEPPMFREIDGDAVRAGELDLDVAALGHGCGGGVGAVVGSGHIEARFTAP